MKKKQQCLTEFVRYGLGKSRICRVPRNVDWHELMALAEKQGVAAIVLDGINRCYENGISVDMDFQTKMDWIGLVHQIEIRYGKNEKAMRQLAAFYYQHGIRMMVLKGWGLSLNYPIPNHRPSGDIDIYLFGEQERADKLIHDELGIEVDNSHHHHTVFCFHGESVENHYDFLNVHVRKSNLQMEKMLKILANKNYTEEGDAILPSVEFNAVHLLRHCAAHFASVKMTVRQVLDWAFFIEKHGMEIELEKYIAYLKEVGMYRFYNVLGLFCIRELGFDAALFHGLYDDGLYGRFRSEILSPEFKDKENGKLLHSLSVKPRRWWHNRWKNRLCYPDSPWSEFAYGLWAKILKPSHFIQ